MPLGPDPEPTRAVLAELEALRTAVLRGEEDVLSSLVVTGEPGPQRVLDDWLDQVADTLRAIGEASDRLAPLLARHAAQSSSAPEPSGAGGASEEHGIRDDERSDRAR